MSEPIRVTQITTAVACRPCGRQTLGTKKQGYKACPLVPKPAVFGLGLCLGFPKRTVSG